MTAAKTARRPATRTTTPAKTGGTVVATIPGAGRFYADPAGYRKTPTGPARPASAVYGGLSKGQARRLRKAAFARGLFGHAAAPRG